MIDEKESKEANDIPFWYLGLDIPNMSNDDTRRHWHGTPGDRYEHLNVWMNGGTWWSSEAVKY
jgi:hypothetical protein